MQKEFKVLLVVILILVVFSLFIFGIKKTHPFNLQKPPVGDGVVLTDGWILPENNDGNYVWGLADGIAFGVQKNSAPPKMSDAPGGTWAPGLIYVMFTDESGETYFFNYLGFSIIGKGGLDQSEAEKIVFTPVSTRLDGEILSVNFKTSKFDKNNVLLDITLKINKNKPREIEILTHANGEVNYVHVSSTAGNLARLRSLYLKDDIVNSKELYSDSQTGVGCFYPVKFFDLAQLRTDSSGIIVYAGNDESGKWLGEWGSATAPYYDRGKFYQYWRKYDGSYNSDLKVSVNGRDNYFSGFSNPCAGKKVNGGIAYENFDMVERYYDEQKFWFGYSYDLNA